MFREDGCPAESGHGKCLRMDEWDCYLQMRLKQALGANPTPLRRSLLRMQALFQVSPELAEILEIFDLEIGF